MSARPSRASDEVVPEPAEDAVAARAGDEVVGARAADEDVVTAEPDERRRCRRARRSRRGGASRRGGRARSCRRSCSGAGARARRAGARRCRTSRSPPVVVPTAFVGDDVERCTGAPGRSPPSRSATRRRRRRRREHDDARAAAERPAAAELDPDAASRARSSGRPRGSSPASSEIPDARAAPTTGSARGAEHDVGAARRPRRAPRDEARVVLGARREPGDRLRDGDGTAPRARRRARRSTSRTRSSGRARTTSSVARPTGSTLPVSTTDVPGDAAAARSSRAGLRSSRSVRVCPDGRAGVAPGDDAVVVARPRLQAAERRRRSRAPRHEAGLSRPSGFRAPRVVPYSNHAACRGPAGRRSRSRARRRS